MSAPNLTITMEPMESGNALYLPLAAKSAGGKQLAKIVLCLDITNHESHAVEVEGIDFSFPGSNVATVAMRGVALYLIQKRETAKIAAGETVQWSNGIVPRDDGTEMDNMVYLTMPAPQQIRVSIRCDGFSNPAKITLPLAAFTRPTPAGAFLFPFDADDLRSGEYFVTSARHWANGGLPGTQIFAHDIGVEGGPELGPRSGLLPDRDGSKNDHYRIWNKPVRAVADGTVESWHDGMKENTNPGKFPEPSPNPGGGNHIWIRHHDELVVYDHLRPNTIPKDLQHKGAPVKAGQLIGRVGNTGNSTNPHTHIECRHGETWGPLRGLPFHNGWVLDRAAIPPPNPEGAWVELTADGISKDTVAIWPGEHKPTWYPRNWGEVAHFGISAGRYPTVFDRVTSSGYRPTWVDAYQVDGATYFNAIFRPADGTSWAARHGMSVGEYQLKFNEQKKAGKRLLNVTSYMDDGGIRYAAIWVDASGPSWRAYHEVSADDHQRRFDDLTGDGFRPVNVSVVSVLGIRTYTALYDKADVGKFWTKSFMSSDEYQANWDANMRAGRQLAYVNACQDAFVGGVRFSAIFEEKPGGRGDTVSRHNLTSPRMQEEYDRWLDEGLLTRCITGYDDGGHRFAAGWRKS